MENTNEQETMEKLQNEEMTFIEYINLLEEDIREEYKQYCIRYGFDPDEEDSAISFIEYREDELDDSMDN